MMPKLIYEPDKCTACLQCMIACSLRNFRTPDPSMALRYIYLMEDGRVYGAYCCHCDEPFCMLSCPVEAITRDEDRGIVYLDPMECIGCRNCVIACPWSIPKYIEEYGVVVKCDLCDGEPECVRVCPTGATRLVPDEEAIRLIKIMGWARVPYKEPSKKTCQS